MSRSANGVTIYTAAYALNLWWNTQKLLGCFAVGLSVDKSAYTLTGLCGNLKLPLTSAFWDSATVEKGIFSSIDKISDELDRKIGNFLEQLRGRALFTFRTETYEDMKPDRMGPLERITLASMA